MTQAHTIVAAVLLALTACGGNGRTRNPSEVHATDKSAEPTNIPPEGPPGQTVPIRQPTNPIDGPPPAVGGAVSTIGAGATGGSAAQMQ